MIRGAVQKFGRFLVSVTNPAEVSDRKMPPTGGTGPVTRNRQFEQRAREILAEQRTEAPKLLAGTIQLLGMEEIRKSLGGSWEHVASQASAIAERTIRGHLGERDIYERNDSETYVICFGDLNRRQAEAKAQRIVEEIKATLAKEVPQASKVQVGQFVSEVEWAAEIDPGESFIDAVAGQLRLVRSEAEQSAKQWRRMLMSDARVVFGPTWHIKNRTVVMFRCLLDDITGKMVLRRLTTLSNPEELLSALRDIDYRVLSSAVRSLHDLLTNDGKALILIPINFQTLHEKSWRDDYLKLCRDVPEPYRRFIVFEIRGRPLGVAASRLVDLVHCIRPFCKSVVVETTERDQQQLSQFGSSGLFGLSLDVSALAGTPVEVSDHLTRYVGAAKAVGLHTIAHGADTLGLAEAATKAHIDYINGKAIAAALDAPRNAYHWNPH
jgi:GGDEF domain-containing protein